MQNSITANPATPPPSLPEGVYRLFRYPDRFHNFSGKCAVWAEVGDGEKPHVHIMPGSKIYDQIGAVLEECTCNPPCILVKPLKT